MEPSLEQIASRLEHLSRHLPVKEFYNTSEFSTLTGWGGPAIVKYCQLGLLEAHQMDTNFGWLIKASELDRLKKLAEQNKSPNRKFGKAAINKLNIKV